LRLFSHFAKIAKGADRRQSRSFPLLSRVNAKGLNEATLRQKANLFWPHERSHNYVPNGERTQPVKPDNEYSE
jgi:hypothetical protein